MKIGLYTRYQYHDISYAAMQLADLFDRWNCQVSILSPTPNPVAIYDRWDGEVVRDHEIHFTDWAKGKDIIIWTHCPHEGQVRWAAKQGCKTFLFACADDHSLTVQTAYPVFDKVILPSRAAAKLVSVHYHANNAVPIPWSPCLPISVKSVRDPQSPVRLHLPLYGSHSRNTTIESLDVIRQLLDVNGAVLAIDITFANWTPPALRWLDRLARDYKDDWRLTIGRVASFDKQLIKSSRHDLALLLSSRETIGMNALCAMHMGLPVLGFDIPPLNEFIKDGRNGLLVPCQHGQDDLGTIVAYSPSYTAYVEKVIDVVSSPTLLAKIQFNCRSGLDKRRQDFESAWARLIRSSA